MAIRANQEGQMEEVTVEPASDKTARQRVAMFMRAPVPFLGVVLLIAGIIVAAFGSSSGGVKLPNGPAEQVLVFSPQPVAKGQIPQIDVPPTQPPINPLAPTTTVVSPPGTEVPPASPVTPAPAAPLPAEVPAVGAASTWPSSLESVAEI